MEETDCHNNIIRGKEMTKVKNIVSIHSTYYCRSLTHNTCRGLLILLHFVMMVITHVYPMLFLGRWCTMLSDSKPEQMDKIYRVIGTGHQRGRWMVKEFSRFRRFALQECIHIQEYPVDWCLDKSKTANRLSAIKHMKSFPVSESFKDPFTRRLEDNSFSSCIQTQRSNTNLIR